MRFRVTVSIVSCVIAAVLLSACGGGGGGNAVIAPDPGLFLYRGDTEVNDVFELFAVSGSPMVRTKLSESPANRGGVLGGGFAFSPDKSWVGYVADPDGDARFDLLVVRPDATGRRTVHAPSATAFQGVAYDWHWAPDSTQLSWLVDDRAASEEELYVAQPGGGPSLRLSGNLVSGGRVWWHKWSPNSQWLAYLAWQDTYDVSEIYAVHPDGSGLVKVHLPLVALQDANYFFWSPDSNYLAFRISDEEPNTTRLFVWTAGSGAPAVEVSQGIEVDRNVQSFYWAPDSSRIAYFCDPNIDDVYEVFTVRPDGTGHVRLNPALVAGRSAFDTTWPGGVWAPDSSRVAYLADQDIDGAHELFVAPADGSTPAVKVNTPLVSGRNIWAFDWAPDGSRIAYIGYQDKANTVELYAGAPGGPAPVRICSNLPTGRNVGYSRWFDQVGGPSTGTTWAWAWSPDSSTLVYMSDLTTSDLFEIYTNRADGTGTPTKLSPTAALSDNFGAPVWSQNGQYIAFGRMGPNPGLFLHRPGSTTGTQVAGTIPAGGNVGSWTWDD